MCSGRNGRSCFFWVLILNIWVGFILEKIGNIVLVLLLCRFMIDNDFIEFYYIWLWKVYGNCFYYKCW